MKQLRAPILYLLVLFGVSACVPSTTSLPSRPLLLSGSGLYNIATDLREGNGFEIDYETAVHYYELAIEKGHIGALNDLGYMYDEGYGVEQNYKTAAYYYELAAKEGNDIAQHNIGIMYERGIGVEQNIEKAAYWYTQAAKQDNAKAQTDLEELQNNIANSSSSNTNESLSSNASVTGNNPLTNTTVQGSTAFNGVAPTIFSRTQVGEWAGLFPYNDFLKTIDEVKCGNGTMAHLIDILPNYSQFPEFRATRTQTLAVTFADARANTLAAGFSDAQALQEMFKLQAEQIDFLAFTASAIMNYAAVDNYENPADYLNGVNAGVAPVTDDSSNGISKSTGYAYAMLLHKVAATNMLIDCYKNSIS